MNREIILLNPINLENLYKDSEITIIGNTIGFKENISVFCKNDNCINKLEFDHYPKQLVQYLKDKYDCKPCVNKIINAFSDLFLKIYDIGDCDLKEKIDKSILECIIECSRIYLNLI